MDAYTDQSHLEVTWVSQSLYSGPLCNPDFFLSLIGGRIRQVVLYIVWMLLAKVISSRIKAPLARKELNP